MKPNEIAESLRHDAMRSGELDAGSVSRIMDKAAAEIERQHELLNKAEVHDFVRGVVLETGHQIERWGTVEDRAKEPQDWFWLLAYLSGKALRASVDGDCDKARHHCISSAAVLANWHMAISGADNRFAPGDSDLQKRVQGMYLVRNKPCP